MAQKNDDLLLLALVFLALLGKGPLSGKPGVSDTGTTKGQTDSGSTSTGNNDNPTDMGVNTKTSPGPDTTNMPGGTGGGAPDKSKNMSPPGTMQGMPTFMTPIVNMMTNLGSKIANLISPTAPTGGTVLPGGNVFIPGLSITGSSVGGPGAGPYTPSITTKYGNTTYTNFNPIALMMSLMPKSPGMSIPEMVKQPTPPMMKLLIQMVQKMVQPIVKPIAMISKVVQNPPPNLVTIMTSIAPKSPGMSMPEMVKQPTPPMVQNNLAFQNANNPAYQKLLAAEKAAMIPSMMQNLPPGKSTVPNPLNNASMMSLLNMLGADVGGFAGYLQSNLASNIAGFKNIFPTVIPPIGSPGIVLPDITI